jgi:phage shock protein C
MIDFSSSLYYHNSYMKPKITLSRTDKKIAGVIGGIAAATGIDSTLMRLLVVFVALVTGVLPAAITYVIAWLIIPESEVTNQ